MPHSDPTSDSASTYYYRKTEYTVPERIDDWRLVVINDTPYPVIVVLNDTAPVVHAGVGFVVLERSADDSDPRFLAFVNGLLKCYYVVHSRAAYDELLAKQDRLFAVAGLLLPNPS